MYIINYLFKIRNNIGHSINQKIFQKTYIGIKNIQKHLDYLCLMRERRIRMTNLIKTEAKTRDVAKKTLDYLNKKLSSKNNKNSLITAKNIVNLITPRLTDDDLFIKEFGDVLSNQKCNKYCNSLNFKEFINKN